MSTTELINWKNQDQRAPDTICGDMCETKPIEMTIALPAYNAKKIIWLALESLKNQQYVNFGWELIIWEEGGYSKEIIESFIGKLPNCQRILHKSLDKKILLIDKWIGIAKDASDTSKIFVLQAADCYSSPRRLLVHYQHFLDDKCYFSTQTKGLFYNLLTKQKIFYYNTTQRTHLNMAVRTNSIKKISRTNKKRGIDTYIRASVIKFTPNAVIKFDNSVDKENWKYSIDTDGCNNISLSRNVFYNKPINSFRAFAQAKKLGYDDMEKYIPENVMKFLICWK